MLRRHIAPAALESSDDAETRAVLAQAKRLLEAGDREQATQCLKRGVDAAWAAQKDRRALRLAAAAAELRESGELALERPDAASSVMAVAPLSSPSSMQPAATERTPPTSERTGEASDGETIDVEAAWLEPGDPGKRGAEPRPDDRAAAPVARGSLGEAVRVWVGPNGELSLYVPGGRPRRGYVEAILVTSAASARLAERVARARDGSG